MNVCAAILWCLMAATGQFLKAQQRITPQPPPKPSGRILVKVRASLAQELEAGLSLRVSETSYRQPQSARVQGFLDRYSARKLAPLYPTIIRVRKENGWTDAQLADHIRKVFPRRTAHASRQIATPEVSRTYVLEVADASAPNMASLIERLQVDPDVEFAESEHWVATSHTPNDPFFSSTGTWGQVYADLWGLFTINAPSAWSTNQGEGIVVAVVDSGIDYNHPDIADNVWINRNEIADNGIDDDGNGFVDDIRGWDFIGADVYNPTQGNDPTDHHGHGTHVAGTIGAVGNNGLGIIGVAPHAKLMALKGLDSNGHGFESTLAPALLYAAQNGADVINASWGREGHSQTYEESIQFANSLGVVFVAGAGNSGMDASTFTPANSPGAITVAASDAYYGLASFSNFGSKIDVTAPGVDILSLRAAGTTMGTPVDTDYTRADGTSMAAPHVSGVVALILSKNPNAPIEDIRQMLRSSAKDIGNPGWDPLFGPGIINAQAALALNDVLQAHISSPTGASHVNSAVTISGFAQGNKFDHYLLEYGMGAAPTTWTQLQTGNAPVSGGVLGTFDAGAFPDGVYTVRLSVVGTDARVFSDHIVLTVDFVSITSPAVPRVPVTALECKPGITIPILGTATGPSFKAFRIQWAEGVTPTTRWNSSGITLNGGGATPVVNGRLGTWDTTGITKAGYYTVRVQVDNAGYLSVAQTLVYLEPDLLSQKWPQPLATAPFLCSGFVPVADGRGKTRLALVEPSYMISSVPAQLLEFSPGGSLLRETPLVDGTYFNPSVGDLDGQPGQEIVLPNSMNDISVFHPDGQISVFRPDPALGSHYFNSGQVVLESLEGGSKLNVVALGNNRATGTAHLFAWRGDGSLLNANFPITVPDHNISLSYSGSNRAPRVLVGDINGDGDKEMVVVVGLSESDYTLALFSHDGTPIRWSVPVFHGTYGTVHLNALALADLDHDGKLEIVMIDSGRTVHVFQSDGTERAGWPKVLDAAQGLVVGDLDLDGTAEIVVTGWKRLYVFKADGIPYSRAWPREQTDLGGQFGNHPVLADIDGDGYPEILTMQTGLFWYQDPMSPQKLTPLLSGATSPGPAVETVLGPDGKFAYHVSSSVILQASGSSYYNKTTLIALRRDNTVSRSWQLLGALGKQPFWDGTIAVGDFDQNGITDIALTYFTMGIGDGIHLLQQGVAKVLSTGAPFRPNSNPWPMIFQDPRNTSVLGWNRDQFAQKTQLGH